MPNVNAPRGFLPRRLVDNSPFSGGGSPYYIPSGYATAFAVGDVMKALSTGYIAKANPGDQFRGIVARIQFVDPTSLLPRFLAAWPAGQTSQNGADVLVELYDDPRIVYEAVITNSATVPPLRATAGNLFNLIDTGVQTGPQLSGEGIDYTTLSTTTGQFRALGPVERADNDLTSAYQRWEFVAALQDFRVNTGV